MPRPRLHTRHARAAVAALVGSAGLLTSGCLGLKDVGAAQPGGIGDVRVSATVCPAGSDGCAAHGNSRTTPADGATGQVMLAYRVPQGARAPAAPTAPGVAFAPSPGYAAELQRLSPAPAGSRWVGYLSAPAAYSRDAHAGGLSVTADFGLPVTPGVPFPGPFRYRPVAGARSVTAGAPATRPVSCGGSLTRPHVEGDATTICLEAPSGWTLRRDLSAGVRDLTVVAGSPRVPVRAGRFARVPFAVRHSGRGAALVATLSAKSSLRGAAVAASQDTLTTAAGHEQGVTVIVAVPRGARRAIHGVTLRATLPSGEAREMTTRIVVAEAVDTPAAARRKARTVRVDWPRDRRASFYNLQLFRGTRKVVSVFPRADRRQLRVRPGRYRVVVWSGVGAMRRGRYAPRPWVNRFVTVRPARTASARARPAVLRVRRAR